MYGIKFEISDIAILYRKLWLISVCLLCAGKQECGGSALINHFDFYAKYPFGLRLHCRKDNGAE